jgi:hypothetical protein
MRPARHKGKIGGAVNVRKTTVAGKPLRPRQNGLTLP